MHLKLDPTYVDPETRTPLPDAVLVVADTEFRLHAGDTRITAAIYATPDAVGKARPVREYPIALSPSERDAQLPALLQALYVAILSRSEYAGATLVT